MTMQARAIIPFISNPSPLMPICPSRIEHIHSSCTMAYFTIASNQAWQAQVSS
jgi:hypothetical protein